MSTHNSAKTAIPVEYISVPRRSEEQVLEQPQRFEERPKVIELLPKEQWCCDRATD